jgi:hypothetical protein
MTSANIRLLINTKFPLVILELIDEFLYVYAPTSYLINKSQSYENIVNKGDILGGLDSVLRNIEQFAYVEAVRNMVLDYTMEDIIYEYLNIVLGYINNDKEFWKEYDIYYYKYVKVFSYGIRITFD